MAREFSPPFAGGAYRSPAGGGSRCCPSLRFYPRAAVIVARAGRLARLGRYGDAEWRASSMAIVRALEGVGVRLEISGVDRVAAVDGPCVFVGNHMSTLETFVLPSVIMSAKRVTFVVKRELASLPVFGHVMRSRDPVLVGRANPRDDLKAVFEGGAARLAAGISIVVFPQTTRTRTFDPEAFNSIGVKLARRAGVPLVPLALKTDAWGNGRLVKDVGRIDPEQTVHIEFGEPLVAQGTGAAEHQRIVEFIRERLLAWGGSVAPAP
jgi:1-acyl-sn-glycerol-3-phosphate acyltransferase